MSTFGVWTFIFGTEAASNVQLKRPLGSDESFVTGTMQAVAALVFRGCSQSSLPLSTSLATARSSIRLETH